MNNELEKQFLDTFGIKVSRCTKDGNCYFQECSKCDWYIHTYPQITDRILLRLICLYNNFQNDTASFFIPFDYKNIKNNILTILVEEINEKYKNRYFYNDVDKLKHQVRTLFEEE